MNRQEIAGLDIASRTLLASPNSNITFIHLPLRLPQSGRREDAMAILAEGAGE